MGDYERKEFRKKPTRWDHEALSVLGEKIVAWAETTESYTVDGYCLTDKTITRQQIYQLTERHEIFERYIVEARRVLADKMVKQSFEGKASPYVLKTFIPMYMRDVNKKKFEDAEKTADINEAAKKRYGTQDRSQTLIVETRGGMRSAVKKVEADKA